MRSYGLSIPCCGQRSFLEQHGVCCSNCYSWQHLECVGLTEWSPNNQYVCWEREKITNDVTLDPGGIHRKCRQTLRTSCRFKVGNSEKHLRLHINDPSHVPPGLQTLASLVPTLAHPIQYDIRFNGYFCRMAYGLTDTAT